MVINREMTHVHASMDIGAFKHHHITHKARRNTPLHKYINLAHAGHKSGNVNQNRKRMFRNGAENPTGFHDFQNLQWDPSIYRGATHTKVSKSTFHYITGVPMDPWEAKQQSFYHPRPRKLLQAKIGGIVKPTNEDVVLDDLKKHKIKQQNDVYNKNEWDAFIIEQVEIPEYKDFSTQSDETNDFEYNATIAAMGRCDTLSTGPSKYAEANIGYVGTAEKDDPIPPLIAKVGSKILEQSLLETVEEYELHKTQIEMGRYLDMRKERDRKVQKLLAKEDMKAEHRVMERIQKQKEVKTEAAADDAIGAMLFASRQTRDMFGQVYLWIQKLEQYDTIDQIVAKAMNPWLTTGIDRAFRIQRLVTDSIIRTGSKPKRDEGDTYTFVPSDVLDLKYLPETTDFSEIGPELTEKELTEVPPLAAPPPTRTGYDEQEDDDGSVISDDMQARRNIRFQ